MVLLKSTFPKRRFAPDIITPRRFQGVSMFRGIQLYLLLFALSIAVTSFSFVTAYLMGFGIWLDEQGPSFWLSVVLVAFLLGVCLSGLTLFFWLKRTVIYRLYASTQEGDPQVRAALGRILLMMAAQKNTALTQREKRLAHGALFLTENMVVDGTCIFCGSNHPELMKGGAYNPKFHVNLYHADGSSIPCPGPLVREIAEEIRTEVIEKQKVSIS